MINLILGIFFLVLGVIVIPYILFKKLTQRPKDRYFGAIDLWEYLTGIPLIIILGLLFLFKIIVI